MAVFDNPFDPNIKLTPGCSCGRHGNEHEHDADIQSEDIEALNSRAIESALVRALFPVDTTRRRFISAVGAGTVLAAISSVLPIGAIQAMAQEKGPREKKDLKIGFIPITCATPLIMAGPLKFYEKEGLDVSLIKTAGW